MNFIFHNIWDVIIPIDELIFSSWLLHHQPDTVTLMGYPLVNVYITMENPSVFNGKSTISRAMASIAFCKRLLSLPNIII
jgi:hypothetical protein